jgi:predicted enzyme related to lactoylglutathione lyase
MSCQLDAFCFDALDPQRLAVFWTGFLGWPTAEDSRAGVALLPVDDTGFRLRFVPSDQVKVGPNPMHFDVTSTSLADQEETVTRAIELGARHIDVGQLPEEGHVVLADPEGNELCVLEPGNAFLADCGFLGAVSGDGLPAVGYFWSAALGWPLVWDQEEETAIRSPLGGPKVTWGGPPLTPKAGKDRVHFDIVPSPGSDVEAEVSRLVALGAARLDIGQGEPWVVMADPGGHEFCVVHRVDRRPG